jgi:hypothetical protein
LTMKRAQIFTEAGFEEASWDSLNRLWGLIESTGGCDARMYKPPKMRELRAAHVHPDLNGGRAQHVFARIQRMGGGIALLRPRRFCKGNAEPECRLFLAPDGSGWEEAKLALLNWAQDSKPPK